MLFNNRDLSILGVSVVVAILALVLPFPLMGRMVIGVAILVIGMIIALVRVGPDNVPMEQWLYRRLRFGFKTRRFVYQQDRPEVTYTEPDEQPEPEPQPVPEGPAISLAFDEVGVEPLLTAALAVLGIYMVAWLYAGGAEEIARFFTIMSP